VFEAFTEVRHLSRWWGPEGFTTTTRAFEFRVGGEWDFVMHGPDGTDYQEWISWTEIAPPERIALLHGESRGDPNAFESVLTFAPDGAVVRMGVQIQLSGGRGPDGMAMDAAGHLFVAHASLGAVFVVSPHGEPLARIASCRGRTTTNVALTPDGQSLVITESATGTVLRARWTPPRHG